MLACCTPVAHPSKTHMKNLLKEGKEGAYRLLLLTTLVPHSQLCMSSSADTAAATFSEHQLDCEHNSLAQLQLICGQ